MRTSIDTCYERVLNRYKEKNKNYTEEDYNVYANKKSNMYNFYKTINKFLKEIDNY